MAYISPFQAKIDHCVRETADGLKQSLKASQPVTTKLIVSSLADRLNDEYVIADLVQRSITGENAFLALLREVIRDEADQIARVTLSAYAAAEA